MNAECHPAIAAIPNWRKKVVMPRWKAAMRLRRALIKRRIPLRIPEPITVTSGAWSEGKALLNAACSNQAQAWASTYGIPEYCPETGFCVPAAEKNEFRDNPELLEYLCVKGKILKRKGALVKRREYFDYE